MWIVTANGLDERDTIPLDGVGAFTKLRKATISFVVSLRPHGTAPLPLDGFA
jgi:hypothetical protein